MLLQSNQLPTSGQNKLHDAPHFNTELSIPHLYLIYTDHQWYCSIQGVGDVSVLDITKNVEQSGSTLFFLNCRIFVILSVTLGRVC